ncbi:17979_t:CDS:2, partial [Racocetra fulgida]
MSQSKLQIPKIGSEFPTVEQFKEAAQQGAKALGFAFSTSSSKMSRVEKDGRTPFVTLQCVMGGKYRNNHEITEKTRKRKKFTKRQNCSVILRATLNENTGVWVHNHELLPSSQVHCLHQHRIINKEQKELVHTMLRIPLLSSSPLSIDKAISKALYKLEEKYESLSDCGSKATFLHKIEALASEEIIVPKAPLRVVSKGRPTSTKRDLLLSERQNEAAAIKDKNIKKPVPKRILSECQNEAVTTKERNTKKAMLQLIK